MLLAWKKARVVTYAGYIIGFPNDTRESISEDVEIIKRELPIDILTFYYLTPLPGSEDHKALWQKNVWMDPDLNKYDVEHPVTDHPRMTRGRMDRGLRSGLEEFLYASAFLWRRLYVVAEPAARFSRGLSPCCSLIRSLGHSKRSTPSKADFYAGGIGGTVGGASVEPIWSFYSKYAFEFLHKQAVVITALARFDAVHVACAPRSGSLQLYRSGDPRGHARRRGVA